MDLIDKLPYFYNNGYTRPIIDAEQIERDILVEEIADVLKQMYVSTATWGLDYWEEMLYLPNGKNKTYEERRSIIYSRMRATRTTTVEVVKELASSFFGSENVIVTENNSNYSFNIDFENVILKIPDIRNELPEDFTPTFSNIVDVATADNALVDYIKAPKEVDTNLRLDDVINVLELYKPAHLNYDFTFSSKGKMTINTNMKKGLYTLPICNVTHVGTWWKTYADGVNNKGKIIKSKSYTGYSQLVICGLYKSKMKSTIISSNTTAQIGTAQIGTAQIGMDM